MTTTQKKKRSKAAPLFGVAVLAVAVLVVGFGPGGWLAGAQAAALEGAAVKRGALSITVVERGNLRAAKSIDLKSEVEGQATILWLIEEGTQIEPGDLLCELDATSIEERRVTQEIGVQNGRAEYEKAKQSYEIQKSQNESDIAAAHRKREFAEQDLKKYLDGDYPQTVKDKEQAITLAQEQVKRDKDRCEWSLKLADKGFLTRTELEADELAVKRSEIELDRARRNLELFEKYEHPRNQKQCEADVEETARELKRVELQAKARIADFDAALVTTKARLDLEEEKLVKYVQQIEKAKIYAPTSGMVVYAQERGGRWGGGEPIQEGTSVRERQEIITIPVTEGMISEVSLHESVLEQVREGQSCKLTCDALPGRTFNGRVKFKSMLPDKNSWWANPNLRVYRTEIEVVDPTPDMRPGMTCSIEILVDEIADCLHVPVQSVFLDRGETICFVGGSGGVQKRGVETGRANHKWVEVIAGLEAGETVLLSQPPGFTLQAAPEAERDLEPLDEPPGGMPGGMPSGGSEGGMRGGGGKPEDGRSERGGRGGRSEASAAGAPRAGRSGGAGGS